MLWLGFQTELVNIDTPGNGTCDWDNKHLNMIMEIYSRRRDTYVAIETMQECVGVKHGTENIWEKGLRAELTQQLLRLDDTLIKTQ